MKYLNSFIYPYLFSGQVGVRSVATKIDRVLGDLDLDRLALAEDEPVEDPWRVAIDSELIVPDRRGEDRREGDRSVGLAFVDRGQMDGKLARDVLDIVRETDRS